MGPGRPLCDGYSRSGRSSDHHWGARHAPGQPTLDRGKDATQPSRWTLSNTNTVIGQERSVVIWVAPADSPTEVQQADDCFLTASHTPDADSTLYMAEILRYMVGRAMRRKAQVSRQLSWVCRGEVEVPIDAIWLATNGEELRLDVEFVFDAGCGIARTCYQPRIPRVEELARQRPYVNVPPLDVPYPGTQATGGIYDMRPCHCVLRGLGSYPAFAPCEYLHNDIPAGYAEPPSSGHSHLAHTLSRRTQIEVAGSLQVYADTGRVQHVRAQRKESGIRLSQPSKMELTKHRLMLSTSLKIAPQYILPKDRYTYGRNPTLLGLRDPLLRYHPMLAFDYSSQDTVQIESPETTD